MPDAALHASMPMDAQAFASRSGVTSPFGKLTAEVPKFRVPEETHDILEREARSVGMSLSEFVRELCIVRAHGVDYVAKLHAERVRLVAGSGGE